MGNHLRVNWRSFALVATLGAGCGVSPHHGPASGPMRPPTVSPPAVSPPAVSPPRSWPEPFPTPTPIVQPAEKSRYVFSAPPGLDARLFVYDRASQDVFAYPQAGKGLSFTFEVGNLRYMYQRADGIFVYDHARGEVIRMFDPRLVGGFAFAPTTDNANDLYFLGTNDPALAAQGLGDVFVMPTPASASPEFPWNPTVKPRNLTTINAVGAKHGHISSFGIDGAGDAIPFTTGDGNLFLYTAHPPAVFELRTNREFGEGRAIGVSIDFPWGRWVVWEDFVLKRIFLFDRWTGKLDPIPNANLADNLREATFPFFSGYDPWHVFYDALLPGETVPRLFAYDRRTERVDPLTLLNLVMQPQAL